jgi:peroxiredoxin/nitrate/TMAO reductase-like tetraheme cytochrome c subunit
MQLSRIWSDARRRTLARALAGLVLAVAGADLGLAQQAPRHETALPRFEGMTLDGKPASTDLLQKRRGLVYVFASSDPDAERVAAMLEDVQAEAAAANVAILGLSRDPNPELARHFMRLHGFEFPVIQDRDGQISAKLRVPPASSSLLVIDAEGYLAAAVAGLAAQPKDSDVAFASELRHALNLPPRRTAATPLLGLRPAAPPFDVTTLDGKTHLTLAELSGKVVVFIFFLPTCPHCHELLKYVDALEKKLANPDLAIVPVSVSEKKYVVEEMVSDLGISLSPYLDPGKKAQEAYAFQLGVPEVFVIDRQGRVVERTEGSTPRIHALLTLAIRQALGVPNPILLEKAAYSGEEFCAVCHEQPHATWSLTKHAYAFDTLVEHGADRNPECLRCHTVGFGEPGGFDTALRQDHLKGVQCENCHGRGGPHQSPDFSKAGFEPTCLGCHTPEHSLRFNFAERLPLVSHAANSQLASLSLEERQKLLEKRDKRQRQLFEKGDYIGSAACQSCHANEHKLWAASPHARAFATLAKSGDQKKPDCQRCHTTGFGEPTGFPQSASTFESVGCESCHGPGKRHVEDAGKTPGTILALTDKCDDCVILQICGSCHDAANDKGFEFNLEDKLGKIEHGFRRRKAVAK